MDALGVAAASGEVVCSAVPLTRPINVTDRPWFDRAVRTQAFTTGDHEIDPLSGKPQLVAALPMPYPGGGTQFVVFAALDLGWVGRFAAADLPSDWAVALSDDRGTILARHPDPWRWVGQRLPEAPVVTAAVAEKGEGTAEVVGTDGVVRLLGFAPVPAPSGRPPRLPERLPAAERGVCRGRSELSSGTSSASGSSWCMAILAVWLGSEWIILRRVKLVADAAGRLAEGDFEARAEVAGATRSARWRAG